MSERRTLFLSEMGLGPHWVLRAGVLPPVVAPLDVAQAGAPAALVPPAVGEFSWEQLEQGVAACSACGLCEGRRNTVFGSGDRKANWLFIGAAPTVQDEAAGLPLSGPDGKLFNNMLAAMQLEADTNVFLTTLVKCRPPLAAASAAEQLACRPWLERQVALLQPRMIVALGAEVAGSLLGLPAASLSGLRGQLHAYAGVPLVVTYDPADLLRTAAAKAGAWSDLCLALNSDAARA